MLKMQLQQEMGAKSYNFSLIYGKNLYGCLHVSIYSFIHSEFMESIKLN